MLSELNSLLEKIPLWKRLQAMPKEIDELKARIVDLETAIKGGGQEDACPKCHRRTFALSATEDDPTFGKLGIQRRVYVCSSCSHTEYRQLR